MLTTVLAAPLVNGSSSIENAMVSFIIFDTTDTPHKHRFFVFCFFRFERRASIYLAGAIYASIEASGLHNHTLTW
eukprot:m.260328 g.260328  ORF g.260328 m.260328 type:complete len:75 (+) comp15558_c0_seq1:1521-1745(+)